MFAVAQPIQFGQSVIWTYRTKEGRFYVYDQNKIESFTEDEAEEIASNYPNRTKVIPFSEAGTL